MIDLFERRCLDEAEKRGFDRDDVRGLQNILSITQAVRERYTPIQPTTRPLSDYLPTMEDRRRDVAVLDARDAQLLDLECQPLD